MAPKNAVFSLTLLASLALFLGTTLALAEPNAQPSKAGDGHRHRGGLFARLDKNADGKIERNEARTAAGEHFAKMDQNGDGAISRDEKLDTGPRGRQPKRSGDHFARLDANKDGKLERGETRMPSEHFDRADANKDGKLTQAEVDASWQAMSAARRAAHFAEFDTNSDGKIDRAEAFAHADRRFAGLDGNKGGLITREEAHAALSAKHPGKGRPHDCQEPAKDQKKAGPKATKGQAI